MASQAEVDLVISTEDTLPDLERDLGRIIRQAENNAPDVDVAVGLDTTTSLRDLDRQITQVLNQVEGRADAVEIQTLVDQREAVRTLSRQIDQVVNAVETGNAADPLTVQAVLDGPRSIRTISGELERATRRIQNSIDPIEIETTVDNDSLRRTTDRLIDFARNAGSAALSVGRLGVAGAGATVAIGTLLPLLAGAAAAAQQIAPAAALAVSGMLAMQLAAGTLKLAMVGVEEAITAAFDPETKPEELEKALKRLAPEARKFVVELRSMRGALRRVQQEVQNRFFQDFDRVLEGLADDTLPVVQGALNRTATSLNLMARGAANAANEMAEDGTLGKALDGAAKGLENLDGIPAQIVRSLSRIGAAAAPAFDKLTRRIDTAATEIAADIERAFDSGALEQSISGALSALGQLKRIGENILGGLGNIFRGLTQDGRGLFEILEDISEEFRELTGSKEFQTILEGIVNVADQLVETALPLLREAFNQLAPVIEKLAPLVAQFIEEVGPELIPVLQELGPILLTIVGILKDQLPFAIEFSKAFLQTLTVVLKAVGFVLETIVAPALRLVAKVFDNEYVRSIRDASRETGEKILAMLGRFDDFRQRVSTAVTGVISRLGDIVNFIRTTFLSEVTGALATVVDRFVTLPGRIRSAIGDVGSLLFSVGADLVRGLIGGIQSQVDRLLGIARGLAEAVSRTIESALDIGSPSRVMRRIGEFAGEGLEIGLRRSIPSVEAASLALATSITPQFGLPDGRRLRLEPVTQAAPTVQVFIGNEQLDARTDARIQLNNKARNRVLSQGVRR